MAYQIIQFDDINLPLYDPQQDHSPVGTDSAFVASVGGMFDRYGSAVGEPTLDPIQFTGLYWGETNYLVDEDGDYLVDEDGDFWIEGDGPTMLRSQIDALREKVRQRGTLWRIRLDDNARQWKTARFLRMSQPQISQDRVFKAEITCRFESATINWHAENVTTVAGSATAGVATSLVAENPGVELTDATFVVTRTSGTVTAVQLSCAALGIGLVWTGTLGSGDVLTFDSGEHTVIKGQADAYNGFALSSHTARDWIVMPRGLHVFNAIVLGGNANLSLSYYAQFP